MTRPMLDTPPRYSFTVDQLRSAYAAAAPWRVVNGLFWEMAVIALLDRDVTDEEVELFRPMIRQAVEEGR